MKQHYHFVGIGGIGMGALASLLLAKGHKVSGSDIKENQLTARLRERGARVAIGHAAENAAGADVVIYSSAIAQDNPELAYARKHRIPVLKRARLLAELVEGQQTITVAGAHGKTTTASMIAHVLTDAGLRPTSAVGGIVNGAFSNAALGGGRYFVAEVDESDGSFLYFSPQYSVITNIDFEHLDYYHNWTNIIKAYRQFIAKTAPEGLVIGCGDDPRLSQMLKESRRPFKTYGFSLRNDVTAANLKLEGFKTSFDYVLQKKNLGRVTLKIPGRHNAANALACITLGLHLSIDFEVMARSLSAFRGVQRRLQLKGTVDDISVIDDYAHHPTEIKAALEAARALLRRQPRRTSGPGRSAGLRRSVGATKNKKPPTLVRGASPGNRLVAVFQPHRFTRLKYLLKDFARSFTHTDHLIVTDVYAASEKSLQGVTAQKLVAEIKRSSRTSVCYLKKEDIAAYLLDYCKAGDLVITLGAGDITGIADDFVKMITDRKKSKLIEINRNL